MKLNVIKKFALPRPNNSPEEFTKGLHDFSDADAEHWMVKACTEPYDPEAEQRQQQTDAQLAAAREEIEGIKREKVDLVALLAAERARGDDLQALIDKSGKTSK